jgi:hypothetical protein
MYVRNAIDHTQSIVDIVPTLVYDLNHNDQQCMSKISQLGSYDADLTDFKHLTT